MFWTLGYMLVATLLLALAVESQYHCQNGSLIDTHTGQVLKSTQRCAWGPQAELNLKGACAAGELLDSIGRGHLTRSEVELVIAHYNEDTSWSDPFSSIRTVYTKGKAKGTAFRRLPNVGREGHTFLTHVPVLGLQPRTSRGLRSSPLTSRASALSSLSSRSPVRTEPRHGKIVDNYDTLAKRTVFLHGRAPSCGFFGGVLSRDGTKAFQGGHLLCNVSASDYLSEPMRRPTNATSEATFFLPLTARMADDWHACSLRSGFADLNIDSPLYQRRVPHPVSSFPSGRASENDVWLPWEDCAQIRKYIRSKHTGPPATASSFTDFWQTAFGRLPPRVVVFGQGGQFAASATAIRQVPRAKWAWLLSKLQGGSEEYEYYMEISWHYLLGGEHSDEGAGAPPSRAELDELPRFLTHLECEPGSKTKTPACARQIKARRRLSGYYYYNYGADEESDKETDKETHEVSVTLIASGEVSDFGETEKASIASIFAAEAGVAVDAVTVTVTAASVNIAVTIATSDASTIEAALSGVLADAEAATTFLQTAIPDATVTAAPSIASAEAAAESPESPPLEPPSLPPSSPPYVPSAKDYLAAGWSYDAHGQLAYPPYPVVAPQVLSPCSGSQCGPGLASIKLPVAGPKQERSHGTFMHPDCSASTTGCVRLPQAHPVLGLTAMTGLHSFTASTHPLTSGDGLMGGGEAKGVVAAGDFNGDGILDMFVGKRVGGVDGNGDPTGNELWLSDGFGGFTEAVGVPTTPSFPSSSEIGTCAAGDFNGDGHLDLFMGGTGASVSNEHKLWLGDGSGGFTASTGTIPDTPVGGASAVGDFNVFHISESHRALRAALSLSFSMFLPLIALRPSPLSFALMSHCGGRGISNSMYLPDRRCGLAMAVAASRPPGLEFWVVLVQRLLLATSTVMAF